MRLFAYAIGGGGGGGGESLYIWNALITTMPALF